jgi:hypothetical protein
MLLIDIYMGFGLPVMDVEVLLDSAELLRTAKGCE